GSVRGEVGRGTIVTPAQEGVSLWWSGGPDAQPKIDLGLVTGMYGLDPDLGTALCELAGRPGVQEYLRYQPSRGMARHREAGALWCSRFGVEAGPERILVTAGGQHALL